MANILNTLRAWGESLFTAKKEWIGTQSYPSASYSEETHEGIGDYENYVSPIDGYVNVQSNTRNTRLGLNTQAVFVSSEDSIGTPGVAFPVKKGTPVGIWCTSGNSYTLRYFKNMASQ